MRALSDDAAQLILQLHIMHAAIILRLCVTFALDEILSRRAFASLGQRENERRRN